MTEVKIMRRKAKSPMVGLRLTKAPQGTSPAAQVKPTVSYAAAVDFHVLPLLLASNSIYITSFTQMLGHVCNCTPNTTKTFLKIGLKTFKSWSVRDVTSSPRQ